MTDPREQVNFSRRAVLRMSAALGAMAAGPMILSGSAALAQVGEGPIVTTAEGQLRGIATDTLHVFKGIRYGESTAGTNRFRPPVPVAPWEGVRDASVLGDQCYHVNDDWEGWKEDNNGSEDCLVLNVWSPIGAEKKPVMVFLHGGGYRFGSGGAPLYHGDGLAARGDVVTVTLNHRLHALGFLHLADLTDGYEGASNAGLLDIVEALRWIQRNIAAFGGDPDNVTIFGQSGGGAKVSSLLAMPSAVGLFHKAIVQSASQRRFRAREDATADAQAILTHLGIAPDDRAALEAVPVEKLYEAFLKVNAGVGQRGGLSDRPFTPVIDPETAPWHQEEPAALALSKDIPLLVGTNEEEKTHNFPANLLEPLANEAALVEAVAQTFPNLGEAGEAKLPALIAAYRARMPEADLLRIQVAVASDLYMGRDAIAQAENRLSTGGAPVYLYRFGWKEPWIGSAWAVHGAELPFIFDKLEADNIWGETGLQEMREAIDPEGQRYDLRDAVVDAWSSFARDGVPSSAKLPDWPAYSTETRPTLRFDGESTLVEDPLGPEIRGLLAELDVGVGS